MDYYAHSLKNKPPEQWQLLSVHLHATAEKTRNFAASFSSEEWAYAIGLLHDLGKARKSFQNYLLHCNGLTTTDYDASDHSHSGAGAVWAKQHRQQCAGIPNYT